MTIWIKELDNILTINKISYCIKKEVTLLPFVSYDNVTYNDIILVSKKDSLPSLPQNHSGCTILIYEDCIQTIYSNVIQEVNLNFDYYYLKNAILAAKHPSIDTLITGSSYGLFGIDETLLTHEVNCSLASQDLYYTQRVVHDVCQANNSIKNLVICCGYYYLFSDLSKTKTPGEIMRIRNVYYPIFNDLHNCLFLPPKQNNLYDSHFFDIEKVAELFAFTEYEKHYFNEQRPRKNAATRFHAADPRDWSELSATEKEEFGIERANAHNKGIHRELSRIENIQILKSLAKYCSERNINLVVVVTPATHYYRSAFNNEFKRFFYDTLNNIDYPIHVLDLFDDLSFVDNDFNDTDHLREKGATKMTKTILELLHLIEQNS